MLIDLMPPDLAARFAAVGRQEHVKDPTVLAKFFHPFSVMTFYATEYDPAERTFFGWVYNGQMSELGYFSLDELQAVCVMRLPMERDLYWREQPLSEAQRAHEQP